VNVVVVAVRDVVTVASVLVTVAAVVVISSQAYSA
jgi:hypothetical protein